MPNRTLLQIQVRTKLILSKIEKEIPKGVNIVEHIQKQGLEWFETKEISDKFKFDNEDYEASDPSVNEPQSSNRNRSRNRHKKEPSDRTLRRRPQLESNQDKKKQVKKQEKKEEESSDSKSVIMIEDGLSEMRFSLAIHVIPCLRSSDPQTASELYKIPPPPPATILPFNTIGEALNKLITDLTSFEHRLKSDYTERAAQLDNNTEIGEYWRGLREYSVSLLHIVNDIALLHQHNEIIRKNNMLVQELPMFSQHVYPISYSESMQGKGNQYPLPNN
jgi:hypothetical protein